MKNKTVSSSEIFDQYFVISRKIHEKLSSWEPTDDCDASIGRLSISILNKCTYSMHLIGHGGIPEAKIIIRSALECLALQGLLIMFPETFEEYKADSQIHGLKLLNSFVVSGEEDFQTFQTYYHNHLNKTAKNKLKKGGFKGHNLKNPTLFYAAFQKISDRIFLDRNVRPSYLNIFKVFDKIAKSNLSNYKEYLQIFKYHYEHNSRITHGSADTVLDYLYKLPRKNEMSQEYKRTTRIILLILRTLMLNVEIHKRISPPDNIDNLFIELALTTGIIKEKKKEMNDSLLFKPKKISISKTGELELIFEEPTL